MSEDEVRNYLDNYLQSRTGSVLYMNALKRYVEQYRPYMTNPQIHGQCLAIWDSIHRERKKLDRLSGTVQKWSELIRSDTRRAIFRDRYLNDMKWEDIEDKYHYCTSTIFAIHQKCIKEITEQIKK